VQRRRGAGGFRAPQGAGPSAEEALPATPERQAANHAGARPSAAGTHIMPGVRVRRLAPEYLGRVTDLLTLAFYNDNGARYFIFERGSSFQRQLRTWFAAGWPMIEDAGTPVYGIVEGGRVLASAVAFPPGTGFSRVQILGWLLRVVWGSGMISAWRTWRNTRAVQRYLPRAPHYAVALLAVHPGFHKHGLARILLDEIHRLSEADPASSGVLLQTENPNNLRMYEHFGYERIRRVRTGPITIHLMFRPRSGSTP